MGLLGQAIGGALAGAGTGLAQDIAARRETALAELRAQREAANISLKAGYDDARAERQSDRDYTKAIDLKKFEIAGQAALEDRKTKGNLTEIAARGSEDRKTVGARISGEASLANLRAGLDLSKDTRLAQLKSDLDGGQVKSVEQLSDGTFVTVMNNGAVKKTGAKGEAPINLRGRKTEDDGLGGGLLSPKPIAAAGGGGGQGAPPPPRAAPQKQAAAKPTLAPAQLSTLYAQASAKAAGGDPRFKGKSATQIKAIVDDGLRNKGYAIS